MSDDELHERTRRNMERFNIPSGTTIPASREVTVYTARGDEDWFDKRDAWIAATPPQDEPETTQADQTGDTT